MTRRISSSRAACYGEHCHDGNAPSRRTLLKAAGALGTGAALTIGLAATSHAADPAFALIDAHRRASMSLSPALDDLEKAELAFGFGSIEAREMEPRIDDLLADAARARVALLGTVPATSAGMTAVLDYLKQADLLSDLAEQDDELVLLMATIRTYVAKEAHDG